MSKDKSNLYYLLPLNNISYLFYLAEKLINFRCYIKVLSYFLRFLAMSRDYRRKHVANLTFI